MNSSRLEIGSITSAVHVVPKRPVKPEPPSGVQVLPVQASVGSHTRPHMPQFEGSKRMSTQTPPPQSRSGAVQVHVPLVQSCLVVHAEPPVHMADAPQKVRSVSGSMQRPKHATCPPGHDVTQAPAVQTSPLAQGLPPVHVGEAPQ